MLLRSLRDNMKIIALVVAVAFIGGTVLVYLNTRGGNQASNQVEASNQAVAEVNGEEISYNEYRSQLNNQLRQLQGRINQTQVLGLKSRLLDQMISQELMIQKAAEKGLTDEIKDQEIQAQLDQIIEQSPASSEEELKKLLEQTGQTLEDYKGRIKEYLSIQKLHEEITGEVEVSEEEIKKEYETVNPSHILIKTDNRTDQEAKQKAEEILKEIKEGEDFAEMAKKHSEGPSAKQGGKLGAVGHGRMAPAFEEKAFSLSVGEVSEPVKTKFGYHLIKVTDKKEAKGEKFEEQKPQLREKLLNQKKQEVFSNWINQQKEEADVVVNDQEIRGYRAAQNENYEEAVDNYKAALQENSQRSYLYHNLAEVYKNQGNEDEAIATYKEATEKFPEQVTFYSSLADLYKESDQDEKAIDVYNQALEENKDNAQLHFNLGNLYRELDEEDKAVNHYERFSELSGDDLMAHYRLYTVYQKMGLSEKANEEREKVREIQQKRQEKAQQERENQQNENQSNQSNDETSE